MMCKSVQLTIGGFEVTLPTSPKTDQCVNVFRSVFLRDEYHIRVLRPSGHWPQYVVDIGANIGSFSMLAADLFPGGQLLAFEPDPLLAACYAENLQDAHCRVILEQAAVLGDDCPDSVLLHCHETHPGGNHVSWDGRTWMPPETAGFNESVSVRAVRLPEMLLSHGFPRIDLLKLDCEGAEAVIMADLAATGWLNHIRWVRLEWHGQDNMARVETLLRPTHFARLTRRHLSIGLGFAHSRKDAPTRK